MSNKATAAASNDANAARRHRPDGPNAGVLATVSLVLIIAADIVPALIAGGHAFVSPVSSTATVHSYVTAHRDAVVAAGFFAFGASVPLGIYAATAYARLLKLGIRVPGPGIAFCGGITASIMLGLSGLFMWTLGQPIAGQAPPLVHTIDYVVFAVGGVGFVVGLGLLVAGIGVPALILRLVPRWLAWVGLIIATLSELSFFTLLIPGVAVLLPIGRFLGLAWLLTVGFLLPRNRRDVTGRR